MPTANEIDARDYGRLEAEVAQLVRAVSALQSDVAAMKELMQEARGGWRAVALVGGISATLTSGLMWVWQHFQFIR